MTLPATDNDCACTTSTVTPSASDSASCNDLVVWKPNVVIPFHSPSILRIAVPSTSFLCTAVTLHASYMRLPATDNHCACTTSTVTPSTSDSASCNVDGIIFL